MTSTPTHDVDATWDQILRLHERGARLARVALPDRRSLRALPSLRTRCLAHATPIPLIADIHFSLAMALEAMPFVDKVRVNPGNLLEAPRSRELGSTTPAHDDLGSLRKLFRDASARKKAVRVGVNQGSLSRRIVDHLGTGVDALVESALEYVRVAEEEGFDDLVISLKSSNPWEVVEANRRMAGTCDYPLHVGVTEAGFGLQGRARSAVGVGLLLRQGLADTIRVSLAEPPEEEMPVAAAMIAAIRPLTVPGARVGRAAVRGVQIRAASPHRGPHTRTRIGMGDRIHDPVAGTALRVVAQDSLQSLSGEPVVLRVDAAPASPGDLAAILEDLVVSPKLPRFVSEVQLPLPGGRPGGDAALTEALARVDVPLTWEVSVRSDTDLIRALMDVAQLVEAGLLQRLELDRGGTSDEDRDDALDILQGVGTGEWRAHLIACPQCGRCRIDVPRLAAEVRARLGAREGLTIGVMGCVVNGPGEMQGADVGCVGEGPGKVALYRRGVPVTHGVPVEEAAERLEELLRGD
jgi:(E)-4-hydroxy-3-methylbut-2-enyl-diphosphate synthase